jgi:hypothetical protein
MSGAIPPLRQYAFIVWCSVKKERRDNFTFTFYIEGELNFLAFLFGFSAEMLESCLKLDHNTCHI